MKLGDKVKVKRDLLKCGIPDPGIGTITEIDGAHSRCIITVAFKEYSSRFIDTNLLPAEKLEIE